MIRSTDTHSLSDFQRNATAHIKHVTATKHPIALTINGTTEVVIQDAGAYQEMIDTLEELRLVAAVLEGEASITAEGVIPAEEVWEGLEKKFGI